MNHSSMHSYYLYTAYKIIFGAVAITYGIASIADLIKGSTTGWQRGWQEVVTIASFLAYTLTDTAQKRVLYDSLEGKISDLLKETN